MKQNINKQRALLKSTLLFIFLLAPLNVFAIGNLYIVGGGKHPDKLMNRFLSLCGKENKLLVVAKASSYETEVKQKTVIWLKSLGAKNVSPYECKDNETNCLTNFQKVKCVYFTGGSQNKLKEHFVKNRLITRVREIYQNGGTIGGSSAGAAIMSHLMITGGITDNSNGFERIAKGHVEHTEGFGFLDSFIIDQHFIKRKRQNRLLSKVLENPELVGVGIDESTAIILKSSQNQFIVHGDGSVVVYDSRYANSVGVDKNDNFHARKISLNILTEGQKFSLLD